MNVYDVWVDYQYRDEGGIKQDTTAREIIVASTRGIAKSLIFDQIVSLGNGLYVEYTDISALILTRDVDFPSGIIPNEWFKPVECGECCGWGEQYWAMVTNPPLDYPCPACQGTGIVEPHEWYENLTEGIYCHE